MRWGKRISVKSMSLYRLTVWLLSSVLSAVPCMILPSLRVMICTGSAPAWQVHRRRQKRLLLWPIGCRVFLQQPVTIPDPLNLKISLISAIRAYKVRAITAFVVGKRAIPIKPMTTHSIAKNTYRRKQWQRK